MGSSGWLPQLALQRIAGAWSQPVSLVSARHFGLHRSILQACIAVAHYFPRERLLVTHASAHPLTLLVFPIGTQLPTHVLA